ncbi:MAG: pilus assembly protein [Sphingobium sp.]|uniref:TadE/TadG family type IV pilus assembly protein n=1 Tax=Sphingobium sp. TaxID=1912891 RepID=UPI00299FB1F6|nr:TadE/TadG family type IV pilus assembly protein [Sphingobium sp.]MDX3909993.1 pilus assembly protein [Sphingobium sp.]
MAHRGVALQSNAMALDRVSAKPIGYLNRLLHNQTGNVLAIVAAALIPLTGMVGAAVDFSRTYLVKARMQQACDAGALAGRRSMSGSTLTAADKAEALRYFNFNFPNQLMGSAVMSTTDSTAANHVSSRLDDGQLRMEATTTVPTTLLQIVGINELRASAECLAEEYYVNTDLMLVLDTTASMNCYLNDSTCTALETEKKTDGLKKSKMLEMRDALKKLYADLRPAQIALEAKKLRMRIGFVPFSITVNVGKLIRAKDTTYIRSSYQYRDSSGNLKAATNWSTAWLDSTWAGCIEERSTSTAITATSTTIPSDAWDLDIAKKPDSDATRWAPYDFSTSGERDYNTAYYMTACPKPAVAMQAWDSQSAFDTQVDTIVQGDGGTYHDIGMIWGLRMIANDGIFGSDNLDKFNNVKVRRTIVLMTDGNYQAFREAYTAYGVARYAGRTAATGTQDNALELIHRRRLQLICAKAKSSPYNVDIWVIGVLAGTAPDAEVKACATNSSQYIPVSDTTDLANAFKRISDKVGNLRLGE